MNITNAFEQYVFEEIKLQGGANKTAQNYLATCRSFINCNGDIPIELITYDTITRWKMSLSDRGIQNSKCTLATINEYLETRHDRIPALFISGQYRRITVQRVEQILHVAAGEAGIDKNVTPHVLRHTFATDLRRNGADLLSVMKQLNHRSIHTTQIYTHIGKEMADESYTQHHTTFNN